MQKLRDRGIFTLKGWCNRNGYPGITQECILSAMGSEDKKLQGLAKDARMKNIVKEKKDGR